MKTLSKTILLSESVMHPGIVCWSVSPMIITCECNYINWENNYIWDWSWNRITIPFSTPAQPFPKAEIIWAGCYFTSPRWGDVLQVHTLLEIGYSSDQLDRYLTDSWWTSTKLNCNAEGVARENPMTGWENWCHGHHTVYDAVLQHLLPFPKDLIYISVSPDSNWLSWIANSGQP